VAGGLGPTPQGDGEHRARPEAWPRSGSRCCPAGRRSPGCAARTTSSRLRRQAGRGGVRVHLLLRASASSSRRRWHPVFPQVTTPPRGTPEHRRAIDALAGRRLGSPRTRVVGQLLSGERLCAPSTGWTARSS
jgi:hypothetical protein